MSPTILEVIGPGFLNQVPTLDSKFIRSYYFRGYRPRVS